MKKKFKRSTVIPVLLLIYLAVMSIMGLRGLRTGQMSLAAYIATIAITLGIIYLLHVFLKKRERLRDERLKDLENSNQKIQNTK